MPGMQSSPPNVVVCKARCLCICRLCQGLLWTYRRRCWHPRRSASCVRCAEAGRLRSSQCCHPCCVTTWLSDSAVGFKSYIRQNSTHPASRSHCHTLRMQAAPAVMHARILNPYVSAALADWGTSCHVTAVIPRVSNHCNASGVPDMLRHIANALQRECIFLQDDIEVPLTAVGMHTMSNMLTCTCFVAGAERFGSRRQRPSRWSVLLRHERRQCTRHLYW